MPAAPVARRLLLATAASAGLGATGCLHVVRDRPALPSVHTPCVPNACGAACETHGTYAAPAPYGGEVIDQGRPVYESYAPAPPPAAPLPMPAPAVEIERPTEDRGADELPPPPAPLVTPAGFTRIAAPRR